MGKNNSHHTSGKSELGKKRQQKRTIGLLAIGASEDKPEGSCPSSEELARFIEAKKISADERSDLLDHIAQCEKCYEEWVTLSTVLQQDVNKRGSGRLFQLFSNPRYLTAVGSGLAVAAGITVFLSISPKQLKDSSVLQEDMAGGRSAKVTMEKTAPEPAASLDYDMAQTQSETVEPEIGRYAASPQPAAAPPLEPDAAKSKSMPLMQEQPTALITGRVAGKGPAEERKPAEIKKEAKREDSGYDPFLESVASFCSEKQGAGQADVDLLLKQWRDILEKPKPGALTAGQVEHIERAISLLEQSIDRERGEICGRLQAFLHE